MTERPLRAALGGLALATTLGAVADAASLRVATFNASMNRTAFGQLRADLESGTNAQLRAAAEIIQRIDPDVLLINEFDYDDSADLPGLFVQNYLNVAQNVSGVGGTSAVDYPHTFFAPSNTGVASGFDLNNNGVAVTTPGALGYGDDALGFGNYPGQFGMAVFSKHDIDEGAIRTFRTFLWKDMPGARLPTDAAGDPWYSDAELAVLPLSSKSHWDIPVLVDGETIHLLASHPTPPVFDGAEDRNGKRNADEIRFWADYVAGAGYIYDDAGVAGGLAAGAHFVIAGDQNADPFDGDSTDDAILQLLDHPLVNTSTTPASAGGPDAARRNGLNNAGHAGDAAFDTADFADFGTNPGNLRADYVLPSKTLEIVDAGVFWPVSTDPLYRPLIGDFPFPVSDHRPVWVDVRVPAPIPVPAALPLMLAGLGALAFAARRRR